VVLDLGVVVVELEEVRFGTISTSATESVISAAAAHAAQR
jgi:hypothetical protein